MKHFLGALDYPDKNLELLEKIESSQVFEPVFNQPKRRQSD
jgi:hypothetical protein